jgi:hypothetical protein
MSSEKYVEIQLLNFKQRIQDLCYSKPAYKKLLMSSLGKIDLEILPEEYLQSYISSLLYIAPVQPFCRRIYWFIVDRCLGLNQSARVMAFSLLKENRKDHFLNSTWEFQWCCKILWFSRNNLAEVHSFFRDLIFLQDICLTKISLSKPRKLTKAYKIFHSLLSLDPQLVEIYVHNIFKIDNFISLKDSLLHFCAQKGLFYKHVKENALGGFVNFIINAKSFTDMSELENYRSTIALLTLDDFEKLIIPPLAKLFLKSGSFASGGFELLYIKCV